ncbi:MAG: NAD(P)H-binding protein [Pseudomonadota bacterium]|nr:NAD(P)H-binding protein [Pseudomonadota bacterium]
MNDKTGSTEAIRFVVAGGTGSIGRAVVRELCDRGHRVSVMVRPESLQSARTSFEDESVEVLAADFDDPPAITAVLGGEAPVIAISCLASRSGAPVDAQRVDYAANSHFLDAVQRAGARRFVLLSAICVQRPHLAFQHAKLRFESELAAAPIDYTIIRPTAFFKSLSGQVKRVAAGKPFLLFGDGTLTRCKPISDADLARFIVERATDPDAVGKVLPIGGPGPAISLKDQGAMLFALTGQPPRYRSISPRMFDVAARVLSLGAPFSGWFAEKAEYARIAKYYATQSMLLIDPDASWFSVAHCQYNR